jgi:hypothetical protein
MDVNVWIYDRWRRLCAQVSCGRNLLDRYFRERILCRGIRQGLWNEFTGQVLEERIPCTGIKLETEGGIQ